MLSSRCIFEVWRGTARWKGRERGCRRSRGTPGRHFVDHDCEDKDERYYERHLTDCEDKDNSKDNFAD